MGKDGQIFCIHIDDLSRYDVHARTAAERAEMAWLKERVACRKKKPDFPPA